MAGSSGDAPLTPVKSTPLPFGKGRKGKGDLEAGTIQLEITPSKSNSKIAELRAKRDEIRKNIQSAAQDLKLAERKRQRLIKRAKLLSGNDLLEVFSLREEAKKKKDDEE